MGLFKIINKVIEVLYRLNLLLKIKIYLVYYITILKLVYKNHDVRVLLAPYLAISWELLGAAKASLWLGLSYPLYAF